MLIYHLIPEAVALLLYFITTIYVLGEKEILRKNDQKRFFRVSLFTSLSIIENFFASCLVMGVLIFPVPVNYVMQTLYFILSFLLETAIFDLVMGTVRMYTPNQKRIDIETYFTRASETAPAEACITILTNKTGEGKRSRAIFKSSDIHPVGDLWNNTKAKDKIVITEGDLYGIEEAVEVYVFASNQKGLHVLQITWTPSM